jgi:ribonuclease R
MPVSPVDLLKFLEKHARRPLSLREILDQFPVSRKERQAAVRMLDALVHEGAVVRNRTGRYSLPRQINVAVGTISAHRDGYGFVSVPSGEGSDVFIPARFMGEAMHGDKVMARVERRGPGGKSEGRILEVLERAHLTVVGRFEPGRRFGYVVPLDPRITHDIFIAEDSQAQAGQIVIVRIDVYPSRTRNPEGTIVEILGDPDDPEVEILTIVHKYGLPYRFPQEVLDIPVPDQVAPGDRRGREDLRQLPLVTIDGETARDFDDAVAVRRESEGQIRLWVAIADVAHYVAEGTPTDLEAVERATSVYFPGRCIPMLPEALSNGICSLNPGVERLAMTAEMLFDRHGKRLESRFYPAVMRSAARLTYTEVRDMVVMEDREVIGRYPAIYPDLKVMEDLALRLTGMRRNRGSLDFDLPEAEVVLDLRGRPEDIVRSERNLAHRIIEEFMLAANEAVASFLTEHEAPLLYRVHEPPEMEKLLAYQEFIAHFNYGLDLSRGSVMPAQLQKLLAEAEGKPEEKLLNRVLLRSMKQARYAPENAGHFGLAADLYCHFTSPIRRYPDLLVHRVLREVLQKDHLPARRRTHLQRVLPGLGEHTSQRERRAMEAEREIIDLKKCQFMEHRTGEEFAGLVSGVQPFGLFVELEDIFDEGLVHISTLADDFYHYEEDRHRMVGQNRRRIFQVGDAVRVRVVKVNLERREIDFHLAGEESGEKEKGKKQEEKVKRKTAKGKRPETKGKRLRSKGKTSNLEP